MISTFILPHKSGGRQNRLFVVVGFRVERLHIFCLQISSFFVTGQTAWDVPSILAFYTFRLLLLWPLLGGRNRGFRVGRPEKSPPGRGLVSWCFLCLFCHNRANGVGRPPKSGRGMSRSWAIVGWAAGL